MGSAASKAAASAAVPKAAAKTAATGGAAASAAKQSSIRSGHSRDAIVVSHLDTSGRDLNGASLLRNPNAPENPVELQEMNQALLNDMKQFEDYEKVDFLAVSAACCAICVSAMHLLCVVLMMRSSILLPTTEAKRCRFPRYGELISSPICKSRDDAARPHCCRLCCVWWRSD